MSKNQRPDWDKYFFEIARTVSSRAACFRNKVGAVIVKNKNIISTGYNGAPTYQKNCFEIGFCYRNKHRIKSGTQLEKCRAVGSHAESNAVVLAAKHGHSTLGATMYIYGHNFICNQCKAIIANSGIKKVLLKTPDDRVFEYIPERDWLIHPIDLEDMKKPEKIKVKLSKNIIFGNQKIYIQTMASIPYNQMDKLESQIVEIKNSGIPIIRLSMRNKNEVELANKLRKKYETEDFIFVADTHFNVNISILALKYGFRKIRINPGNMSISDVKEIIKHTSNDNVIRIGINGGSVVEKIGFKFNEFDVLNLMKNYVSIFTDNGFNNLVLSAKFSNPEFGIKVNKLLYKNFPFPLHLGVTEAGDLIDATVKHTKFFSELLPEGIGDTIRVSITDNPLKEIDVALSILKNLKLIKGINIISCPTCGRTWGNLEQIINELKNTLKGYELKNNLERDINIAIMGCEVNGPGEAKDADFGVSLTQSGALLFEKRKFIKKIKREEIINSLLDMLKKFI